MSSSGAAILALLIGATLAAGGDDRRPIEVRGIYGGVPRAIFERGDLRDYRLAHAARADFCRRLGRTADALAAYERALALARLEPERRFLERRIAELSAAGSRRENT